MKKVFSIMGILTIGVIFIFMFWNERNNRQVLQVRNEGKEAEECTQNAETQEDTIVKISDCLSEQVPEIDDWAAYVDRKSDGQAYLYQTYDLEVEEVYKNGAGSEYLGEYYSVHVREMWEDHSVSWSTFYVSVNFDKVLWKDMVGLADSEFEVYTLEEWRNSLYYPSLDD